jgi:hypothetical protein
VDSILPTQHTNHPELRELAHQLAIARFQTRAPSTLEKHRRHWDRFVAWLQTIDPSIVPTAVPPTYVAMWLMRVSLESHADQIGPSRVLGASAAIACFHWFHGQPSPTQHPLCDLVRELSRRKLHGKQLERDPIEAADMRKLIDQFAAPSANLRDLMHVTMFALMYSAFLRFDDASQICVHHEMMRFNTDHVQIFIPKSKTDQYMEGAWVVVAKTSGKYCAVSLLQRLLREGHYNLVPAHDGVDVGPLLRALAPGSLRLKQTTGTLLDPIPALSYTTLLKHCKEMCVAAGIQKTIGLHSFRIGGATAAAAAGVPDRIFKRHGRWKTDSAKDLYVRETLDSALVVSQALAL